MIPIHSLYLHTVHFWYIFFLYQSALYSIFIVKYITIGQVIIDDGVYSNQQ